MPISLENKSRYPSDWKQIRSKILERAGNKCEICGVANYELIYRGVYRGKTCWQDMEGNIFAYPSGEKIGENYVGSVGNEGKLTFVVLTIAHLDHTPENNDPANLKALCQKCHLGYDKDLRRVNSAKTRANKRGQMKLEL